MLPNPKGRSYRLPPRDPSHILAFHHSSCASGRRAEEPLDGELKSKSKSVRWYKTHDTTLQGTHRQALLL